MKEIPKIHEGEYRFCLILWENEPISAACKALLRGTWMEANNELYSVEASLRARCAEERGRRYNFHYFEG